MDFSAHRKALLRPLFKYTSVDFPSIEDPRNFPCTPGVFNLIRNTGGRLKIWDMISAAKESFPRLRIAQVASPEFAKVPKTVQRGPLFCSTVIVP